MWKTIKEFIIKAFNYFSPTWCGNDGKPSMRSLLALMFSIDLVRNISFAVKKWSTAKSYADLSILLAIESGLIIALLGIKAVQGILDKKMDKEE